MGNTWKKSSVIIVLIIAVIISAVINLAQYFNNDNQKSSESQEGLQEVNQEYSEMKGEETLESVDPSTFYIGKYRFDDSIEYHRLIINEDHTARIVIKRYRLFGYYDSDYHPGNINPGETLWSGTSKKDGESYLREEGTQLDPYGYPYAKIELKEEISTEAYSWDVYENKHLGTYLKLIGTGGFNTERFVYGGRIYNSYEAMLAKDESRSDKIIKL